MRLRTLAHVPSLVLIVSAGTIACSGSESPAPPQAAAAASAPSTGAPNYRVDPFWPQELPNNWILGQVSGLAVDDRNHVWIVHRPSSVSPEEGAAGLKPPTAMCCVAAPPVVEFDPEGRLVRAWGGPGPGYDWFQMEHGIYVDRDHNVWVGGNGEPDNHILKFTADGKFLMQIGKSGQRGGSNDPATLGGPAAVEVDADANEVYVADGYKNHRIVVFDATTGAYKRHWGAYGESPVDPPPSAALEQVITEPYDPAAPPPRQFRGPVHGVALSKDGLVYVTDRMANRLQVFRKNGEFVRELLIRPETRSLGTAWDVALSRDADQGWIAVADGSNHVIWMIERASLQVIDHIGHGGRNAGQFGWVHNLDLDANGNIFTAEVETGKRVQKFSPVGN